MQERNLGDMCSVYTEPASKSLRGLGGKVAGCHVKSNTISDETSNKIMLPIKYSCHGVSLMWFMLIYTCPLVWF